jgi:lycopene cyclase domain-containing protein
MIPDHFVYLSVDIGCVIIPLLASFLPSVRFYDQWKFFLPVSLFTAVIFIIWDCIFTYAGVWSFNDRYVLGYYFLNLPVEELAFFICIPFACMFTFYVWVRFVKKSLGRKLSNITTWLLAAALLIIAATHLQQAYTSVTFFLLGAFLILLSIRGAAYLPYFYVSFLLVFIPFLIANGILTGTGLDEPVVRYNDAHNLKIRILTIPVEDVFYGMLFQLMNTMGYLYVIRRRNPADAEQYAVQA